MKTPWIIYVEFGAVKPSAALRSRLAELARQGVEVYYEASERLTFRIGCQGYGVTDAMDAATAVFRDDVAQGALPSPESVACHRPGAREVVPELLGLAEVSRLLDVSRQRVTQLAKQPSFPLPVARLAMGPVFSSRSIKQFMREWQRKVGRPRLPSYAKSMVSPQGVEWRRAAATLPTAQAADTPTGPG